MRQIDKSSIIGHQSISINSEEHDKAFREYHSHMTDFQKILIISNLESLKKGSSLNGKSKDL